jgi:sugar phosphate isomerase/epimerase
MPGGILENVRRFGGRGKHFHANEPCGKGVGMPLGPDEGQNVDMTPVLRALRDTGFSGWVSVEPFDYNPDPTTVAEVGFKTLTAAMENGR